MIKKIILYGSLTLFLLTLTLLGVVFFKPHLVINVKSLKYALEKTDILKKWSWKEAHLEWGYKSWKNRTFKGRFKDLCIDYESEAAKLSTCIDELSWNVENIGLEIKTLEPLKLHSSFTKVILSETEKKEESATPEIWKYWEMLWDPKVPELDILFKEIKIVKGAKEFSTDFKLLKKSKELQATAQGYELKATPEKITVRPPSKIEIPHKVEGMEKIFIRDIMLVAVMKESGIPLEVTGAVETAAFKVNAFLDLPIKEDFNSLKFKKKLFLSLRASMKLPGVKKSLSVYAPNPFKELPAPFNVMDGTITVDLKTEDLPEAEMAKVLGKVNVDLESPKQVLNFNVDAEVPVNLSTQKPDSVLIGLEFNKVQIQLPRLSKKAPPPQLIPDSRFKKGSVAQEKKEKAQQLDVSLDLQAEGDQAMRFRTNLLDEIMRLNFNLHIAEGKLKDGYLSLLPLKTTIFKRPIHVMDLKVTFRHPVEPVLDAVINFPLPEYKITLTLEGPVSKPRYSFTSKPPLPQNDIYAVLLFGRPLADLDPDDKTAAQKTNQLLSQGILSLSVLYFLAGSPVEYVGYDPGSGNTTAQFGLGSKTSLRIGGGQGGLNSSAIRRSLGKGWYLDTSVQNSKDISASDSRNYGVLLERIITY